MKSPAPDDDKTSGLATGLLIFGAILAFAYLPKLFGHAEGNMAGKDAPELALKLVANAPSDSNDVSLAALRGHTVLLDFWATWCGPCRAEAPIVNKIAQRYHDQGLAVIGVNTSDQRGTAFGVESLPTLVVISKTGKVTAFRSGTTSEAELDEMVQREL